MAQKSFVIRFNKDGREWEALIKASNVRSAIDIVEPRLKTVKDNNPPTVDDITGVHEFRGSVHVLEVIM